MKCQLQCQTEIPVPETLFISWVPLLCVEVTKCFHYAFRGCFLVSERQFISWMLFEDTKDRHVQDLKNLSCVKASKVWSSARLDTTQSGHNQERSPRRHTLFALLSDRVRILRRQDIRGKRFSSSRDTSDHRNMFQLSRYSVMGRPAAHRHRDHNPSRPAIFPVRNADFIQIEN
jgi:hypothetical protein